MRKTILLLGVVALMLSGIPAIADDDVDVDMTDITVIEDMVGDQNLKFTGEIRARMEYTDNRADFNSDFPAPPNPGDLPVTTNDDQFTFAPYRVRMGLIGKLPRDVYAFIQLQVADTWGLDQEQQPILKSNSDPFSLYQAFIKMNDINGTKNDLYIGRQELVFGTEFLLGNLDFYNGVSHDGVRYRYGDVNWLDVFWMKENETFANDRDSDLFGVNYAWNDVIEGGDIGVYLLYLRNKLPNSLNLPQQNPAQLTREDLFTLGGRVGKLDDDDGGFIYNAELAIQFGTVGAAINPVQNPPLGNGQTSTAREDASVLAYGFEGMFGYDFGGENSVWIRGYYTSGDDDASDDEIGEFNPLFQDFHTRNGIADVVGPTNLTSLSIGYMWDGERNDFGAEIFQFNATESTVNTRDANGNTNIRTPPSVGSTVGGTWTGGDPLFSLWTVAPNTQDETNIGQELDLWYDFTYSENLSFNFGLGLFFPGDAVKNAVDAANGPNLPGTDDMVTRLFGQADLTW